MAKGRAKTAERSEPKSTHSGAGKAKRHSTYSREDIAATSSQVKQQWKSWYAAIPSALAVLFSLNTLGNKFASDDTVQVVNNTLVQKLSNLYLAFTTSVWSFATSDIKMSVDSYYRPMFSVLFTLTNAVFGKAAWGWHLTNVLIHGAVAFLVFVVLREFTKLPVLALLAASLFAVHPVHSESVAWISGVTDPMLALFLLPAFYYYLRFRKTGKRAYIIASLILYFFGLMSKETAIALPAVIGFCEFYEGEQTLPIVKRALRASALPLLFLAPTGIYLALRSIALAGMLFGNGLRYPLGPALMTVPLAITKYLQLLIIPANYSYQHYTELVGSILSPRFLLPVLLVGILGLAIYFSRSRVLTFAAIWFIATLAPALAGIRGFDPEYLIQERYLYLPSIAFCLAVAMGVLALRESKRLAQGGAVIAAGAAIVVILVWGVANMKNNRAWYDTLSVNENSVAVEPNSPMARTALAQTDFDRGKPTLAEEQARKALALDPHCTQAYMELSYFAKALGRPDQAIEYLEQGLAQARETPLTRFKVATLLLNLGMLRAQQKDFRRAEEAMRRSLDVWPRAVGWYYVGEFYLEQSRYDDARLMLEEALPRVPRRFAPIHARLGLAYEHLGQTARAREAYQRYLELAPINDSERDQVLIRLAQL